MTRVWILVAVLIAMQACISMVLVAIDAIGLVALIFVDRSWGEP